jgi:inorganic pyrophosphatase
VPIGGLRLLDGDEADDKIIAVLEGDAVYGAWRDVDECPPSLLDRLRHYFLTYKDLPGEHRERPRVEITEVYGREEAHEIIRRSQQDYAASFGPPEGDPRPARPG